MKNSYGYARIRAHCAPPQSIPFEYNVFKMNTVADRAAADDYEADFVDVDAHGFDASDLE